MIQKINVRFFPKKDYCHLRLLDEKGVGISCLSVQRGIRVKSGRSEEGDLVWIVKNSDIETILLSNGARIGPFLDKKGYQTDEKPNVFYLNEEPVRWYEYTDTSGKVHRCFNLTRGGKFFNTWLNYDCPTLYMCETNRRDATCTAFGQYIPVFSETAIDVGNADVYINSSLPMEDIRKISDACYGSWTGERLQTYMKNRSLPEEEVAATKQRVEAAEQDINNLIDANMDKIMATVKENEPDSFCFDCGWLYWAVTAPKSLRADLRTLKDIGVRCTEEPKLKIGLMGTQSTIAQSAGARVIQSILNDAGYGLSFRTHLD